MTNCALRMHLSRRLCTDSRSRTRFRQGSGARSAANISQSYDFGRVWTGGLIFDKQYETAYGHNSLPSGLFVRLTWRPW
jgi:hypothetical protein